MNRRSIILGTAVSALGAFAGGAYLYRAAETPTTGISADAALKPPFHRDHAPIFGPVTAPVTITEFFDPACEACRAFYPVVKQIMGEFPGKVRVVLRYTAFHGPSEEAIRLLEASRLQGLFEPVLEQMLATQPMWAPHGRPGVSVLSVLEETGLDVQKAQNDAFSSDVLSVLELDAKDVEAVGVSQTPTFFVNGRPLPSFGAQQLYDLVFEEVSKLEVSRLLEQ